MGKISITFVAVLFFVAGSLSAADIPPQIQSANTVAELKKAVGKSEKDFFATATPIDQTSENAAALLEKFGNFNVAAGEKMLQIAKNDEEKQTAYQTLLEGCRRLDDSEKARFFAKRAKETGMTNEDFDDLYKVAPLYQQFEQQFETAASRRLKEIYAEIEKTGKFPKLIGQKKMRELDWQRFLLRFGHFSEEQFTQQFTQLKKDAKNFVNNNPKDSGISAESILELVLDFAGNKSEQLITNTKEELTNFLNSDECLLPQNEKQTILDRFDAILRRSVGAELKLYGKTIDGKDFDWDSLRGKIVLVKFTSTWCGPCQREVPGMLKAYEKYHDKGLEIVSVYVWQREDDPVKTVTDFVKKEKLPWIIVSETLTEKAGGKPQSQFYKIPGVPTMLLVGKDGKIIDSAARGSGGTLQKRLILLFGQ
ncbi:MAG: TlpA family protein disulfide reductase [Planctomycetaceae bacterium]|nr:TlpA family protein disulfide reductase [Planctomycetaceae bacterium]